jgi:hypothetical protein
MRSRAAAAFVTAGLTLLAVLGSAGAANADPRNGAPVTITCDNGSTYEAVLFSNGEWSPALDTGSNAVLVPLSIGPSEGAVTDPEGNVIEPIDEPISVKGNAPQGQANTTSCTFLIDRTDDEGFTLHIEGSVVGLVTPARG